ncbi:transketolase [Paenibacillus hamazuiensis]|uniref:transketolase n=1 Tax=Paenibacillus hamazuiensis TaxID=2936508 RepID=UPI002010AF64|nr:transketolase [Paenibacillus hamazuiensis]
MEAVAKNIDQLAVDAIRMLSIDAVEKANSGHPGMPMGAAPMAYTLWTRILNQNGANPRWFNRDRFVLSAGHGSMLLYSLLHLGGFGLTMDDIKSFRQWGSKTPGHPEYGHTPGVEATTGPLGQGVAMAVGMAMAERYLAAAYNRDGYEVVDHYTYSLCGDGDLMEGVGQEAASLAGHLKLGRLIVLYDANNISLDGDIGFTFTEDVQKRFEAYGWQTLHVRDGNDLDAIEQAVLEAKQERGKPSLIVVQTTIGYGSPNKGGKSASHGAPLGASEVELVRKNYGWPHEPFHIPQEVREHFARLNEKGAGAEAKWNELWQRYQSAFPELAEELEQAINHELPAGWDAELPVYSPGQGLRSTRQASEDVLNAIAKKIRFLLGGSADLASSNKTLIRGSAAFGPDDYKGRNIWYGVREFAMGAIMNGLSLHGGIKTYGGTFLVFSDYMRPAMRLSALMNQPVVYVFTHDSIAYGEDGPTHQPIEHIPSLRLMPNMLVIRPADANETAAAYRYAFGQHRRPVSMILSRQDLPILEGTAESAALLARGAYVLYDADNGNPDIVLMASGSEVSLIREAYLALQARGLSVRVVSMPCLELFEEQPRAYRNSVIPPSAKLRVAVEMAHPSGWERYVGENGFVLGIDRFGASAPGDKMMQEYGFTAEHLVERVESFLGK